MKTNVSILLIGVVLAATAALVTSQPDSVTDTLMKAKSGYAHRLLDAVVQEDFDVIQDQAFRLKAVAETAQWRASEVPAFVREADSFIRATDRLYQAAKEENGDAAALAYMDVTLTCIHCHRHLRTQ